MLSSVVLTEEKRVENGERFFGFFLPAGPLSVQCSREGWFAKSEKARNDILAQFPPELISQLTNVKELTILSFIDEEISSRKLI